MHGGITRVGLSVAITRRHARMRAKATRVGTTTCRFAGVDFRKDFPPFRVLNSNTPSPGWPGLPNESRNAAPDVDWIERPWPKPAPPRH